MKMNFGGGGIIGIVALLCAIWVIYDVAINQRRMKSLQKILWILAALFFNILTAIVYFFTVKKGKF